MHSVVKILTRDDGELVMKQDQTWCLVQSDRGGRRTLCGGEYFGLGESGCEYKEKEVQRGGITCNECLRIIKEMKSIKL